MKLMFLVREDHLAQTANANSAACLRFLVQKHCRLFEFDTENIITKEINIPAIAFGEKAE